MLLFDGANLLAKLCFALKLAVLASVLALPLAVAGCGTTAPDGAAVDTPNQRMAVAEFAYQAALKGVDQQVTAGKLKGADAAEAKRLLQAAKAALDVARVAMSAGRSDAATALAAAQAAVAAIVLYLQSKSSADAGGSRACASVKEVARA